jgi:3alpha(or 20beta)-hydroxysteroid dehydrogenase
MPRLEGKVAIVTGAARGMGAAIARAFVAEGAKVALADLLEADASALAAELGPAARFYRHDVTNAEAWERLARQVEEDFGPIDVLVNNAGVLFMSGLFETTEADFDRVFAVNFKGPLHGIQAIGPRMVARGKGSIINTASVEGGRGANALAAYTTSKWALRGLTKVAAMELSHRGVRVNAVLPGGIDTPMSNPQGSSNAEVFSRAFAGVPARRAGRPEEIAKAVLFLASDESSYVMGSDVVVDGGMTAGAYTPGFPGAPD